MFDPPPRRRDASVARRVAAPILDGQSLPLQTAVVRERLLDLDPVSG
jgi:hypothetical protein